jgi:hypothetical protein
VLHKIQSKHEAPEEVSAQSLLPFPPQLEILDRRHIHQGLHKIVDGEMAVGQPLQSIYY